jgi:hypothetical protein
LISSVGGNVRRIQDLDDQYLPAANGECGDPEVEWAPPDANSDPTDLQEPLLLDGLDGGAEGRSVMVVLVDWPGDVDPGGDEGLDDEAGANMTPSNASKLSGSAIAMCRQH